MCTVGTRARYHSIVVARDKPPSSILRECLTAAYLCGREVSFTGGWCWLGSGWCSVDGACGVCDDAVGSGPGCDSVGGHCEAPSAFVDEVVVFLA